MNTVQLQQPLMQEPGEDRGYPLTREQEGFWVEWKRNPADTSYNTCVQLRLQGRLDVARFRQAATDVVEWIEMLRAFFVEQDGKPVLKFSHETYTLPYIDLSTDLICETVTARTAALAMLDEIRRRPLSLDSFPLIHAALVKTAIDCFYFIGVVPHIISDGASAVFFLQALSVAYNEGKDALREEFGTTRKTWLDYLGWRQRRDYAELMKAADSYWSENLAEAVHCVDFGGKPARNSSNAGRRHSFELSPEVSAGLRKLARTNKTSLFSVLAALYALLIHRYYATDEILVGYSSSLRPPGFRYAFGFFVNVLPLKVNLTGDPDFSELVRRIHARRKLDKLHEDLPSLDIVRAKRRSDPEFNGIMFNISMGETVSRLQNLSLIDIESTPLDNDVLDTRDDLSFFYEVTESRLALWFEYHTDVFEDRAIAQMARHMVVLAGQITSNPGLPVSRYTLLTAEENRDIAHAWNPACTPAETSLLHTGFERQAAAQPDAPALMSGDHVLSYGELNRQANRMAWLLKNRGMVDQGDCIALLLPRSFERIIAMLAVLKAGGMYLPIEPETPPARIRTLVSDSGARTLISMDTSLHLNGCSSLAWGELVTTAADQSDENPYMYSDNNPAYLIYTSGSTGIPKGVLVNHRALSRRLAWLQKSFPLQPGEYVLQNTSYSFDVSVAEIFWPLSLGATLVQVDNNYRSNFHHIAGLMRRYPISAACVVPSALGALLKAVADEHVLAGIRFLLAAGEALSADLVRQYYRFAPAGTLYNVYGPTEATIYASCVRCDAEAAVVSIGRAIDHTLLYILNDSLQLQPAGAIGELYIGGDALSEGYWRNPELTAAHFLRNPYAPGLIYKTGDLARYSEDGEIICLGRRDGQVKIRGHRIETGEISAQMLKLPGIADAVVIKKSTANPHLAAFYTGTETDGDTIRQQLKGFLPDYMLPASCTRIEAIPRLESGKTDLKALNRLATTRTGKHLIPPETAQEKTLIRIWSEVLRIPEDHIGVNSNFFELGGDSLMTFEVAGAAQAAGIPVGNQALLSAFSIRDMLAQSRETALPVSGTEGLSGPFSLLPRHLKFFNDGFVRPAHWNRCIVLEFTGPVQPALLEKSLQTVVDSHAGLRLSFSRDTDGWHGWIHEKIKAEIETHDLSNLSEPEIGTTIARLLDRAHQSLDLSEPRLIRALCIHLGENSWQFALVIHHLLVDMRSCRVLLEDLLTAYQALLAGGSPRLMTNSTSLMHWSRTLQAYARTQDFSNEIGFWRAQLIDANTGILRDQLEAEDLTEGRQCSTAFTLDTASSTTLADIAIARGMTLHELLLALFAEAYGIWSSRDHLTVNTCAHGREPLFDGVSLIRTVGWINTVFPIRVPLNTDDVFATTQGLFGQLPMKGIHYGLLRYIIKDPRICALEEPQIFFNYVSKIDTDRHAYSGIRLVESPEDVRCLSAENRACYLLYAEAAMVNERIELSLGYNGALFTAESIAALRSIFSDRASALQIMHSEAAIYA